MAEKNLTISDVARLANVSSTTVSRYLNGHYEYMSEKTRAKLEKIIADKHYTPNSFARGLKSKKSRNIAVLIALSSQTFTAFLQGICSECYHNQYTTTIFDTFGDSETELRLLNQCASDQIAGVLLYPSNADFSGYEALYEKYKIPIVMVNRYLPTWKLDAAFVDHYNLTWQALERLWAKGYRRIMMISDDMSSISSKHLRCKAFLDFSFEHGLADPNEIFAAVPVDEENIGKIVKRFLERFAGERCAIFAINIPVFQCVMAYVQKNNISLNEYFGVCTYDSRGISAMVSDQIVRVQQPIERLGREATKLLINRIEEQLQEDPVVIRLEGEVIG